MGVRRPFSRFVLLAAALYALSVAVGQGLYTVLNASAQAHPFALLVRLAALSVVFVWAARAAPDRRALPPVALVWASLWIIVLVWSGGLKAPAVRDPLLGYIVGVIVSLVVVGLLHWGLLLGLRRFLVRLGRVSA